MTLKRLGTQKHNALLKQPLRVVQVQGSQPNHVWVLATNALGLPAEWVALAYHHRWLKCVLDCRHLLTESPAGVMLQVYCAIIAALLIGLWTGTKPNNRTYKMLCHYFNGCATAEELERHLRQPQEKTTGPPSNS